MPTAEQLPGIQAKIRTAEAAVAMARKETDTLRKAGLLGKAAEMDAKVRELERTVQGLKTTYGA